LFFNFLLNASLGGPRIPGGIGITGKHQLLVYVDDVNLVGKT
jgi:hypothetical protein